MKLLVAAVFVVALCLSLPNAVRSQKKLVLDFSDQVKSQAVVEAVKGIKIKDQVGKDGVSYWITNIKIVDFSADKVALYKSGYLDFIIDLRGVSLAAQADMKLEHMIKIWIFKKLLTATGVLYANADNVDLNLRVRVKFVNGQIKLNPVSCKSPIGNVDVKLVGTNDIGKIIANFFNLVKNLFKKNIISQLDDKICDSIEDSLADFVLDDIMKMLPPDLLGF